MNRRHKACRAPRLQPAIRPASSPPYPSRVPPLRTLHRHRRYSSPSTTPVIAAPPEFTLSPPSRASVGLRRPLPPSSANSPSNDRHPRPVICGLSNSPRELFSFAKLEFSPPPPPSPLSPLFHRPPLFVSVYDRASIGDSRVRILSSDRMNSFFSPTRRRTFSFGDGGASIRSPWNARYAMKFLGVSHRVTL